MKSNEPVIVRSIVGAVVTAVVGLLVSKGWIVDPSPATKETIVTAVGGGVMLVVGWLARRHVTPAAKDGV